MLKTLLNPAPQFSWNWWKAPRKVLQQQGQTLWSRKRNRVRTPTLLQMEAGECGAAALGIILGYYGRIVPLAELRQACGISRDGSSAANVVAAAKAYGLNAKGFKKELQSLMALHPPYIVFWQFDHFFVVEGFSKEQVFVNDPAAGRRTVSLEEFNQGYTGIVLVMEPNETFQKGGKKKSVVQSLQTRLQESIPALLYCIAAGFLLVIPNLAVPVYSQVFIDNILINGRTNWLAYLLAAMGLTITLQGLLTALQLRYLRKLKIKLSISMSSHFIWHLLKLPISYYAQRYPGEISSRIRINDRVATALTGQLTTTLISAVVIVFYAAVMLHYSPLLTLIVICFAIVNVLILQWVARQRVDANIKAAQNFGKVNGVAIAGLQSIETLKASGLESDFFSRWAGYYTKAINAQQELNLANQKLSLLPSLITALSTVALLSIGGWQVIQGQMSIGMLLAFQLLTVSFLAPVNDLVRFGSTLQDLEGNLLRLDDVLDNATDPALETAKQQAIARTTPHTVSGANRLQGYIELKDVTFGYSRVAAPLIQNFNLSIKPGQRVALVGGSGSGKSTLAKIIAGLYEPWSGTIYFDGIPREGIGRSILTNSISVVDQDIILFADTIRANLTLWDATISGQTIEKACQDAAIHEAILSIPGGYRAPLIEGAANLSGGQRQRLEIARSLVNNPAILIMDEATSALDAETEKIIDQNLRRRGCTCLIVAHRLSTIRDCDEIIVLERGKAVQRGTHETLWQEKGHYAQLITSEGA
ncbi:NHLP family bacteriocin export ABC transporter peptidase/permease/ATPase subunit [Leptolyngbya sp. FACHB-711]|uniref:NHLP family bacteriocin export ABC transporter peptidase/permease/ATPase subunit n=1 Tax=unclassified Leptolyngbya TaxID=2650499 RepID=UPI001683C585|nr:NHLP family bacteriocin export ABC transporter peptidase/permease/ATPase subunit [Leptolyngbya sp. FACHB-711]MBD1852295.1 NHLP family bacteriocin export ABC transporter peptidase/permease/ATPase subunit [Cyanobacteria bacterium FACHB-502]MBD2023842.1 NHLP family bacteriocin export ABC transporter peptidase/permease/ATPase subunit [Leptolyngbya sp. FACHB-711]